MTVLGLPSAFVVAALVALAAGGEDADAYTQRFAGLGFAALAVAEAGALTLLVDVLAGVAGAVAGTAHLVGGVL